MAIKKDEEKQIKDERKYPYAFTDKELKFIMGGFETEYVHHCTGEKVYNNVLGNIFQGIVDLAEKMGVIVKKYASNYESWAIVGPKYYDENWRMKYEAMMELRWRQEDRIKKRINAEPPVESFDETFKTL